MQVATVTGPARDCIESAGGIVRRVYYNKLGMRALLLPEWFEKKGRAVPGPASMIPFKKQWRYDELGVLPAAQRPAELPST
jgi:large subunit ribosomal protein L15